MRISRRIPLIWSCLMPLSNTLLVQQPCCKKRITSCATEGVGGHRHSEVKRPNLPIARGGMEWFPARLSHISFYSKDSQPAYARSRVSRSPLATTKSHL